MLHRLNSICRKQAELMFQLNGHHDWRSERTIIVYFAMIEMSFSPFYLAHPLCFLYLVFDEMLTKIHSQGISLC